MPRDASTVTDRRDLRPDGRGWLVWVALAAVAVAFVACVLWWGVALS